MQRSRFEHAEGLTEPNSTSDTLPPSYVGFQTHALKGGQQFHNNIKTATGSKALWPRLTQPDRTAIFIPRAERIDRIQNYFCD